MTTLNQPSKKLQKLIDRAEKAQERSIQLQKKLDALSFSENPAKSSSKKIPRGTPCEMGHTPLSPGKERARSWWLNKNPSHRDIITISHGLLGALEILQWKGKVFIADRDPAVRNEARCLIKDYPDRRIQPIQVEVEDAVISYCNNHAGYGSLPIIDLDLTGLITSFELQAVLKNVLNTLLARYSYNAGIKVILTFRNGRDGMHEPARLSYLKGLLPQGVRYIDHITYESSSTGRYVERRKGSTMITVMLQVR